MSAPPATKRQPLRGMPNVLSSLNAVQPLTEAQGRDFLVRFAVGDPTPLNQLTPMPNPDPLTLHAQQVVQAQQPLPHGANPVIQAREFGLVVEHDTGEAHLIVGQMNPAAPTMGAMVAFGPFITLSRCVAHSHPLITPLIPDGRRIAVSKWADRGGQVTGFAAVVGRPGAFGTYLPTGGDVGFISARKLSMHTVYTPYRIHGAGDAATLQAPEVVPADPLLSWEINEVSETASEYRGSITAFAGPAPFWSATFTMNREVADTAKTMTGFVFGTPKYSA